MENRVLIDTDIIIDYLRDAEDGAKTFETLITQYDPCTSFINKFELLCGIRSTKESQAIEDCLSGFSLFNINDSSAFEASKIYIHLRKKGSLVGIRDIMIAGIAISYKIPVATRNIKEFSRIPNLRIIS